MGKLTDDVPIDRKTLELIKYRIILEERENEKSGAKDPARMVKTIARIIEEEVDQACL